MKVTTTSRQHNSAYFTLREREKNPITNFRRSSAEIGLIADKLSRSTEAFLQAVKTAKVKSNISFLPNLIS